MEDCAPVLKDHPFRHMRIACFPLWLMSLRSIHLIFLARILSRLANCRTSSTIKKRLPPVQLQRTLLQEIVRNNG
ncbi:hypothetical protein X801_05189 [Opisthorchis viverrini]|uniref:Uncharacterized protein n=1 Tax=Opisthorchis viverrini TaxID=6198 RepID=A0A1S8WXI7_OPIVI|nr:hypothetical protein X801_05189 [Opisthorchis viverrini]